jgi:hypothetical protein
VFITDVREGIYTEYGGFMVARYTYVRGSEELMCKVEWDEGVVGRTKNLFDVRFAPSLFVSVRLAMKSIDLGRKCGHMNISRTHHTSRISIKTQDSGNHTHNLATANHPPQPVYHTSGLDQSVPANKPTSPPQRVGQGRHSRTSAPSTIAETSLPETEL